MTNVYWDACVFISLFQRVTHRIAACESLVASAKRGEILIVTSTLSIVEVNKYSDDPESATLRQDQSKEILQFLENPFIVMRQLDRPTAELAHELTRTKGLKPADAIHLATALRARVSILYTYDTMGQKEERRVF